MFTFSEKPVFVYGLLTEPGEKSTIFTIFGSYKENGHSWLILQINTTDVLGKGTGDRTIADTGSVSVHPVALQAAHTNKPSPETSQSHTAQPVPSTPAGTRELLTYPFCGAEIEQGA